MLPHLAHPRDGNLADATENAIPVSIIALLTFVLAATAHAQINVDLGIRLPTTPRLVVVPEVRSVQYAPAAPANLFVVHGQYWAFARGVWYVSSRHSGPWLAVPPQFVPQPLLLVPVRYYPHPPGGWKKWHHDKPPRWGDEWGRQWEAERRAWERERSAARERRRPVTVPRELVSAP